MGMARPTHRGPLYQDLYSLQDCSRAWTNQTFIGFPASNNVALIIDNWGERSETLLSDERCNSVCVCVCVCHGPSPDIRFCDS